MSILFGYTSWDTRRIVLCVFNLVVE